MSALAKAKIILRYVPLEAYLVFALLMAALFWSGTRSNRTFWGDMACRGYLFPKAVESDPSIKRDLQTPAEQREAFTKAAHRVGADADTADKVGKSAALLCNQKEAD